MLYWIGEQLRTAFLQIPLWVAKGLFLGVFFALMIWIVQLPKSATTPQPNSAWHEDLRIWAWLALLIQLFVYAML
jgi:hypothetical protein